MQDVADECDFQPIQMTLVFANRKRVEQGLGGMFVRAVAGIHNRGITHARQMPRRSSRRMTNDNAVGRHCFQVPRGVEQGLAFRHTGGRDADVYSVG